MAIHSFPPQGSILSPRIHHLQAPYKHSQYSGLRIIMSSSINGGTGANHVQHHPLWYSQYSCAPTLSPHPPPSCSLSHVPSLKDKDPILLEDPKVEDLMELVSGELEYLERELMARGDGTYYAYEALSMVDLIQRLGIARFFEHEIQSILHKISLEWDEQSGLKDKDATIIAFHLLRLQGYSVSSEVLERAKDDEKGGFFSLTIDSPRDVTSLINLYKCSQVAFPHELETMQGVEEFAKSQLQKALLVGNPNVLSADNLEIEIRFALEYPRRYLSPRLESRSIIRQLWPSNGWRKWCLELAKIDLEMLQRLHQRELQLLEEWWEAQGFEEVPFARRVAAKCFLLIAPMIFEPQFSAVRVAFTKAACIVAVMDDLVDDPHSHPHEISSFNEAVQRWDPSFLGDVKEHKVIFTSLCRSVEEMAHEASRLQNRELLPLYKTLWTEFAAAVSKWRVDRGHVPPLDEYLDVGSVSTGAPVVSWTSAFFLGCGEPPISDAGLRRIGKGSRLTLLVGRVSRLVNDVMTADREAENGELASVISCYRRGREGRCTEQQALQAIQGMIEADCRELEWELFQSAAVAPARYARAAATSAWAACLLYKRADGLAAGNDRAYEEMVRDYLYGPLNV